METVNYFIKFSASLNLPISVCGAGIGHTQEHLFLENHRGVLYTSVSGCGIILSGGKKYLLDTGAFAYVPQNVPFEICAVSEGWKNNWVSFESLCEPFRFFNISDDILVFKPDEIGKINAEMERIYREIQRESREGCANASVILYQLFFTIDCEAERVKNDGRARPLGISQSRVMSLAADFIEKNFSRPLMLAEICKACGGISEQYLCRQFKKHYGMRPFEYILNLRVRYAKFLLAQTDEPILTVAERSGFENISYFYKKWKLFEEIPPTKWRNEHINAFV